MTALATGQVAGVDGCRGGWVVASWKGGGAVEWQVVPRLAEVVAADYDRAALDMPVGLLAAAVPGGRACDRAARALLGWPRSTSVFSAPCRDALAAATYAEALRRNRASSPQAPGLSIEAFHLFPKLREVEAVVTPEEQVRLFEAHPEAAFARLNGGPALRPGKKTAEGRALRLALLEKAGITGLEGLRVRGAAPDDLVDAAVLAWVAAQHRAGRACRLPDVPPVDARGLRMEIWY